MADGWVLAERDDVVRVRRLGLDWRAGRRWAGSARAGGCSEPLAVGGDVDPYAWAREIGRDVAPAVASWFIEIPGRAGGIGSVISTPATWASK